MIITIKCECGEIIKGYSDKVFACPTCLQVFLVKVEKAFNGSRESKSV